MAGRVLDSTKLINCWRKHQPKSPTEAESAARQLQEHERTKAIVTPVRLEFMAGVQQQEQSSAVAFLKCFRIIDQGQIPAEDWQQAEKTVRRKGRHRPFGAMDSLIRAIADRLNYEVVTDDTGMPPVDPPYRKKGKLSNKKR